jgi:hypothetical protein
MNDRRESRMPSSLGCSRGGTCLLGWLVVGLALAPSACVMSPQDEGAPSAALEQTSQNLLLDWTGKPWPRGRVNVCFRQTSPVPSFTLFAEARTQIISAQQGSWEQAADIKFSFDQACSTRPVAYVNLVAVKDWGGIAGVSPFGMQDTAQITLNYCVPSLGGNCSTGSGGAVDRLEVLRSAAIHEFGHLLGFRHEHQKTTTPADTANWCDGALPANRNDPNQAQNHAFLPETLSNNGISNYRGPYDKDSIMNYCRDQNNDRKQDGSQPWAVVADQLSAGDKQGAAILYGPRGRRLFVPQDYDGDGRADYVVFRPSASNSTWFVKRSGGGADLVMPLGNLNDTLVPGDYDGDRKTDPATFRSSTGIWLIRRSTTGAVTSVQFGRTSDIPVPGDFDGDGKVDPTIFRKSEGNWYSKLSAGGSDRVTQFGESTDIPVRGDFDGDGKADPAVFRPRDRTWYALLSTGGPDLTTQFGEPFDYLVPDDYDADGKTDVAVYRPSDRTWYAHLSAGGSDLTVTLGTSGDRAVNADYDGDGKADPAMFLPPWRVHPSAGGDDVITQFGVGTDIIPYQK